MERREAPGASACALTGHDAARRAPLRRREHPNDAGVRRLPALHRDVRADHVLPVRGIADFCS